MCEFYMNGPCIVFFKLTLTVNTHNIVTRINSSYMKITLLSSLFILIGMSVSAQVFELSDRQLKELENAIEQEPVIGEAPKTANAVNLETWATWWDDWASFAGGFRASSSFFAIYPDTHLTNISLDDNTNEVSTSSVAWCSVGQGFDPKDPVWIDPEIAGLRTWYGYTLDSGSVNYGYFRHNDDTTIVDTLIVQFFKHAGTGGQLITGNFTSEQSSFTLPQQNRRNGTGSGFEEELRIPLKMADETPLNDENRFTRKTLTFPLNDGKGHEIDAGQVAHITVSFKPGQAYSPGDTLYYDPDLENFGVAPPTKRLNRLGVMVSTETPGRTSLKSLNNGSFIVRWNRYEDPENTPAYRRGYYMHNRFGNSTDDFTYYPQIGFHIKGEYNTGVEELNQNGYGVGEIYPNPTSGNATLEFALGNDEQVELKVLDLTGKQVKVLESGQFSKGEHKLNFDVSDLDNGMYIYQMTAGEFNATGKFHMTK